MKLLLWIMCTIILCIRSSDSINSRENVKDEKRKDDHSNESSIGHSKEALIDDSKESLIDHTKDSLIDHTKDSRMHNDPRRAPWRPPFHYGYHHRFRTDQESRLREIMYSWMSLGDIWKYWWYHHNKRTTVPPTPKTILDYDEWLDEWNTEQEHIGCGLQDIEPRLVDLRIIGGTSAIRGSWPWMVSLKTAGQHFCGGVLISREWVVSAAHCMLFMPGMDDPTLWEIRLGRFDPAFNVTEPKTEQTFNISGKPIFYDGLDVEQFYAGVSVDNDLVLLKLVRPAIITKWVKPICLPEKDEEPENGERCVITGYGQTIPNVGPPSKLKQAIVPIVDFETCQNKEGYKRLLTSNMICAGYKDGGVDSCKMDSGGPLQCFGNERWVVSGITSWGDAGETGCAKALRPGVYTKVSSYSSWIKNMMYEDYVATRNQQ